MSKVLAFLLALMILLLTCCGSTGPAETGAATGSVPAEEMSLPAVTDASVVGSDKTDAFCENIMFPALTPYRQKEV